MPQIRIVLWAHHSLTDGYAFDGANPLDGETPENVDPLFIRAFRPIEIRSSASHGEIGTGSPIRIGAGNDSWALGEPAVRARVQEPDQVPERPVGLIAEQLGGERTLPRFDGFGEDGVQAPRQRRQLGL